MYLSWCVPIPSTQSCLKLVSARRLWPNGPQGIRSFRCGWWFQIFSSIAWTDDDDDDDKNAVSIVFAVNDGWWWLLMMMMMVIMTMKPTKCSIAWWSWLTENYFLGALTQAGRACSGSLRFWVLNGCWCSAHLRGTLGEVKDPRHVESLCHILRGNKLQNK